LKIYRRCYDIDAKFKLDKPNDVLPLTKQAYTEHRYESVLQLAEKFENLYPEHSDGIEIVFIRAKAFTELGYYDEASVIIKYLLEYKAHSLHSAIKSHAVLLMKLKTSNNANKHK